MVEHLSGAQKEDVEVLLLTCSNATQNMARENVSKLLEKIGEMIPTNHPNAEMLRAGKTAIALLNKEQVSETELNAAISCYFAALDDPKYAIDAAGQLSQMLCAMGLAGMPRERLKTMAEELEEKTKGLGNLPFDFYQGGELTFHILEEYDKAIDYAKRAIECVVENTRPYFMTLYNYVTLMQECGKRLETQPIVEEALPKIQKLFGENNATYCCFKMAQVSNLLELKKGQEVLHVMDELLPIIRQQMGEIDAMVVESARVRALALIGKKEEALELAKRLRAAFVEIGGEDWTQVKALDRIIQRVQDGYYQKED